MSQHEPSSGENYWQHDNRMLDEGQGPQIHHLDDEDDLGGGVVNPSGPQIHHLDDEDDVRDRNKSRHDHTYSDVVQARSQDNILPQSDGVRREEENSRNCCQRVSHVVNCVWVTSNTQKIGDSKEHIRVTLREFVVYVIFLVDLCIITFTMNSTMAFYYTDVVRTKFIDEPVSLYHRNPLTTYRHVSDADEWYQYAKGPLVRGLYPDSTVALSNSTLQGRGVVLSENRLIGIPRIRQLRVRNDSCSVHEDFKELVQACYSPYSGSGEDTRPYGLNESAWVYHSSHDLDGGSYRGRLATYGGGGYVQDLTLDGGQSKGFIATLESNHWIDRGTRAIFIDFNLYNANINLFCIVRVFLLLIISRPSEKDLMLKSTWALKLNNCKNLSTNSPNVYCKAGVKRLLCEFPATGGAVTTWNFRTVKLIRYVSVLDYFVLACEILFIIFILYYIIEEILEMKHMKLAYMKSFWSWLDMVIIIFSICTISFNIYRTSIVNNAMSDLNSQSSYFSFFDPISYWQLVFNYTLAFTVFLVWIKLFKFISFNKIMTQMSVTLGNCAKDIAGFSIMFFIVFLAFAQLGYLIFGNQVESYCSFESVIFTQFRIILGEFNFHELEQANRVLGPLYFVLYVFFVFLVLLNMFLAIVNDTYSEVKSDLSRKKNDFEISDYFKRGYQKMLDKLNLRRDCACKKSKSTKSRDTDSDKRFDLVELKSDLMRRGYTRSDVTAVFSKFDLDGCRGISEADMKKVQADLDKSRFTTRRDYDDKDSLDDSDDEDDDDVSIGKSSVRRISGGSSGVSRNEFTVLQRRVDRMEHSIGAIVSKIDAVLVKLDSIEKAKARRRETVNRLLDGIAQSEGVTDESKCQHMERLVREELERWESESCISGFDHLNGSNGSSGSGRANQQQLQTQDYLPQTSV